MSTTARGFCAAIRRRRPRRIHPRRARARGESRRSRAYLSLGDLTEGLRSGPNPGLEVRDMDPLVLAVDMAGLPQAWVELEEAITYHAKQMVAWSVGREVREFRGGWQKNGARSRIATRSILAIKGSGA